MRENVNHTPGPWRAWRGSFDYETICIYDVKDREVIGWTGFDQCHIPSKRQRWANACLIAAAPKMLATLKDAIAIMEQLPTLNGLVGLAVLEACKEAVAEAEGGSHV